MCAVGYAVVKYLVEKDIPGNALKVGGYLLQKLQQLQQKYPFIKNVRGKGLLVAIEFDKPLAQDIMLACLQEGLWTNRVQPNSIRMMPPLIIGNKEVDQAVMILEKVLAGVK